MKYFNRRSSRSEDRDRGWKWNRRTCVSMTKGIELRNDTIVSRFDSCRTWADGRVRFSMPLRSTCNSTWSSSWFNAWGCPRKQEPPLTRWEPSDRLALLVSRQISERFIWPIRQISCRSNSSSVEQTLWDFKKSFLLPLGRLKESLIFSFHHLLERTASYKCHPGIFYALFVFKNGLAFCTRLGMWTEFSGEFVWISVFLSVLPL